MHRKGACFSASKIFLQSLLCLSSITTTQLFVLWPQPPPQKVLLPASCTNFATACPITFHFGSLPVAWVSGLYEPVDRYKIGLHSHTTTHTPLASRPLVRSALLTGFRTVYTTWLIDTRSPGHRLSSIFISSLLFVGRDELQACGDVASSGDS